MTPNITTLLIDAGGVLVLPDPAVVRDLLGPYGARPDDDTCRRAHYVTMHKLESDPTASWEIIDRTYARVAGVPEYGLDQASKTIAGLYTGSAWVAAPGALDLLARAHERGLSTVIVSNAYGTMERILATAGICSVDGSAGQRVAAILDSDVIGLAKPDPRIFIRAAGHAGAEPHQCLHIGDTIVLDVRGAEAAGMVGVHFDPFELCADGDHPHVSQLGDLAG